jgi:DNA-3-methyladenine glycosylase
MEPIERDGQAALKDDYFAGHALSIARRLLGKYLIIRLEESDAALVIRETEAYIGAHDLACHGRFGVTPRTAVLFGPPGRWYVHFVYGLFWMLNVVTGREGVASGVLLRAAGPHRGPGVLTRSLGIDKRFNGQPIAPATGLWIEDRGGIVRHSQIIRSPRVGIGYAGEWKDKPYRFRLRENESPNSATDRMNV